MGPATSDGPTGLDPFGKCPKNPKDGELLGGDADYDYAVTERIEDLRSRLEQVSPDKAKLADELAATKTELKEKKRLLKEILRLVEEKK